MSYNDITGAKMATKAATENFRDGWDRIFGKKEPKPEPIMVTPEEKQAISDFQKELEAELSENLQLAVARELVSEKHAFIDEDIYKSVIEKIFGKGGTQNAFDAPIIYELLMLKHAQRQSDDIREEWYEYCLAQDDRSKPFPTFQEFFNGVFKKNSPDRWAWLTEYANGAKVLPTKTFEQYLAERK